MIIDAKETQNSDIYKKKNAGSSLLLYANARTFYASRCDRIMNETKIFPLALCVCTRDKETEG